ncbi:coenzyme F420-0:L-glutamate ligase [Halanaeroarchaeum sulfurireducens]|uniref:Coenzyme F420:L-glutamate ligase n=1 Tax=Halanaeroarchaeum sulfurireducens TaxID=1604004 RepID=A0A0F7P6W6_9EURY|nr:coenzyme F420-0:L-glutamate ligase [Halanaeroarchaeum sulfurireducens]AKH96921.1 F420-0--gamma-glutamyl ligase [Halanaeroarchaeum sulfurireducens]ALG81323.1 F420-0--gamma-glutamyl ligase [Halanaeroarchaeum sulfurireducens]
MQAFAIPDLPEIGPGDDLAAMVSERADLIDGDVVLVASTVVSKAEGRAAHLADYEPGSRAVEVADRLETATEESVDPRFVQAVLEEARALVMTEPFILAVTDGGHVGVNAGIDRSNTGGADLLLLPEDPHASADRIRETLDPDVAVIVTDTSGRPFRIGQRGVAIGWSGMPATRDWRGETDRDGRELEATVEAVVDELAATANLLTGEADGGTPVAVVRGFDGGSIDGSDTLFRDPETDFVRQALQGWSYAGH